MDMLFPLSLAVLLMLFFVLLVAVTRRAVRREIQRAEDDLFQAKTIYQNDYLRKYDIDKEKKELEQKSAQMFALYDITREITKSFNEQEAFLAFRIKLKEHLYYEECRLLDPLSEEVQALKKNEHYLLFILRGKTRLLGYLALKGLRASDREKANILAHQFALALQRIRLYQEVERLAITDSLTGLHTRRYILERFEEELSRAETRGIPLSFLMLDVDHFKRFNDQHGHLTGDQILRGVAALIRESVREIDIVGRFGGEEFCVVLPDTDRDGASYVAQRICSSVAKNPIKAYDTLATATVSIGVSTYPNDGQQTSALLDKADWALYRAKKKGRNCVCHFGVY